MKKYTTAEYSLQITLPPCAGREVTLAFFTDMHNCCGPEEAEELMNRLCGLAPDIVLCGGDSITASPGNPVREAVSMLQMIAHRFPLVVGTGNHEFRARLYPDTYGSMYEAYREPLLRTDNLFLLENRWQTFQCGGIPLTIYGFELPRTYYKRIGRRSPIPVQELTDAFGIPDREGVSILLSHNPASLPSCMEWGADLTLCGHYHGGMMRFGRHSGLISPEFRLFPNNVYGHFQTGSRHGIISSGCGEHTVPLRIRNPREIVGIHITITD